MIRGWWGLARSFWIYRRPGRLSGLKRMYAPLVRPGDLVFDIGAHLGDRTRAFRKLGARVVAVEPQPQLLRWLHCFHGRDSGVTLLPVAVGAQAGRARLAISQKHPAVASLSADWRRQVMDGHSGFDAVEWDGEVEVEVTTLAALIDAYGTPDFCKIDVEGNEAEVLAGLPMPLAALSLEFVQGALDRSVACVDRLETLGEYRWNVVAGEGRRMRWPEWRTADAVRAWLNGGADQLASGDLYARLATLDP